MLHIEKSIAAYLCYPPIREISIGHIQEWMFGHEGTKHLFKILKSPRYVGGVLPHPNDVAVDIYNQWKLEGDDLQIAVECVVEANDRFTNSEISAAQLEHMVHAMEGFIKDRMQARGTELIATADSPAKKVAGEQMWSRALNFTISTDQFLDLSDMDVVMAAREKDYPAGGSTIMSNFQLVNRSALAGGYKYGDLVMIAARPGGGKCHAKGAKIVMHDGSIKLVEEVLVGDKLMGPDGTRRRVVSLARGQDKMYRVTPKGSPAYVVNGAHILHLAVNFKMFDRQENSAQHRANISVNDFASVPVPSNFSLIRMSRSVEGEGATAKCKVQQDSVSLHGIEQIEFVGINDYYGFELDRDHLYMTEDGIVHHNSTTMCAEGACAIDQGFKVCHVFIGDMSEWDGYIKYASYWMDIDSRLLLNEDLRTFVPPDVRRRFGELRVKALPADTYDVYQIVSKVNQIRAEFKFDMLIIDYDANIKAASAVNGGDGHMYSEGGNTYANFKSYSGGKCVTLIGSQIKTDKWSQETIPMEAAAESSKKPHHVDIMLTIGVNKECKSVGTLNIAKMRRGESNIQSRVFLDYAKNHIREITPDRYNELIAQHTATSSPMASNAANPGFDVPDGVPDTPPLNTATL